MATKSVLTKVVVVGEGGVNVDQVTNALRPNVQSEFELVDVIFPQETLIRDVRIADPELIVADYKVGEQSILDVIDELAIQVPEASIIAIIPADDPVMAQQVTLAGARAFIVQPFTQVNLLSTLRRVRDLESRYISRRAAAGAKVAKRVVKTISVYSPRGRIGVSKLVVNSALATK